MIAASIALQFDRVEGCAPLKRRCCWASARRMLRSKSCTTVTADAAAVPGPDATPLAPAAVADNGTFRTHATAVGLTCPAERRPWRGLPHAGSRDTAVIHSPCRRGADHRGPRKQLDNTRICFCPFWLYCDGRPLRPSLSQCAFRMNDAIR